MKILFILFGLAQFFQGNAAEEKKIVKISEFASGTKRTDFKDGSYKVEFHELSSIEVSNDGSKVYCDSRNGVVIKKLPDGKIISDYKSLTITYENEEFEIKFLDKTIKKNGKKIIVKSEKETKEYNENEFNETIVAENPNGLKYNFILNKACVIVEFSNAKITITADGKQHGLIYEGEKLIEEWITNADGESEIKFENHSILLLSSGERIIVLKNVTIKEKLDGSIIEEYANGEKVTINSNKNVKIDGNTTVTTYDNGTKITEFK